MLYHEGLFYDAQGWAVAIVGTDGPFTLFDNGQKRMTCEVQNKINSYNRTKAIQISNRIELERLINKRINVAF